MIRHCNLLPIFAFVAILSANNVHGQQLSEAEKGMVETARAKYYDLKSAGFESLSCSVKFDLGTVPLLPAAKDDPVRILLERTTFTLAMDRNGRSSFEHRFPDGTSDAAKQAVAPATNLLTSLVTGLFQTWPTKGLQGPIPRFDSSIEHVVATDGGYLFSLRVPGGPVQIATDKDFLVTEIVSLGGRLKEHPTYRPTPEGLVFAANAATDKSNPESPVEVSYELGIAVVNGLQVPGSVRLRVNQNMDMRFVFEACTVTKGIVVHVGPPPGR